MLFLKCPERNARRISNNGGLLRGCRRWLWRRRRALCLCCLLLMALLSGCSGGERDMVTDTACPRTHGCGEAGNLWAVGCPADCCWACTIHREGQGPLRAPLFCCWYPETCQQKPAFSGHQKVPQSNVDGDSLADFIIDPCSFPITD